MGFDDWYRLSAHAVITNAAGKVLLLRATYADRAWGLPGGALDPGETVHEALRRECLEETGTEIEILHLTGVYAHTAVRSHAFVFRCSLPAGREIRLSAEHSEFRYMHPDLLPPVQRRRVIDCIEYDGTVRSARF